MKFVKRTDIDNRGHYHPGAVLPTVLMDPRTDIPLFEFKRDRDGRLSLTTDDPQLIDLLTSAGYDREED